MTLVSVIMPTYNGEKWVMQALDSVINQTYKHLELIVVDDGSSDDTVALVRKKLREDFTGNWQVIELGLNRGPSAARNVGLRAAKGDWVQFMDCDDFLAINKLELQMAYCETAPADVAAVYSPFRRCFVDKEEIVWDGVLDQGDVDGRHPNMCLIGGFRPLQAAGLTRRSVLNLIRGFDESLRFWECEEINVRIAKAGRLVKVTAEEPTYMWRMHRDKSYIGGDKARYKLAPTALSWIEQLVKAADNQSLDQLCLRPQERLAVVNQCTMWARMLYRTDRPAFHRFLRLARSLDPHIAPSQSRWTKWISRYVSYEAVEEITNIVNTPRRVAGKTLRRLRLRNQTALFDLD